MVLCMAGASPGYRQPERLLDLGMPRYETPGDLLSDLDVVDASLRANGSEVSFENKDNKTKLSYVMSDDRIARLAKEVLNGRRRNDQT